MPTPEEIERELNAIGALNAPSLGEAAKMRSKTPPAPLPDEDRQLVRQVALRIQQKVLFIEGQLAELKALAQGLEDLAAVPHEKQETSSNGTSVHQES
jgi:hypothetical protein